MKDIRVNQYWSPTRRVERGSKGEAANVVGVRKDNVYRAKSIPENDPKLFDKAAVGDGSVRSAYNKSRAKQRTTQD